MPTPTESYFTRLITECRSAFDRSRTGILCRLGIRPRPTGNDDGVAGRLRADYQLLTTNGRVVWGAVAQVNMHMFSAGRDDHPGVTVYSLDSYYDEHPQDLAAIGRACFQFKNTVPADAEFRRIAEVLTDEYDQTARMSIPERLTDGRRVFMGATMFHRVRLPGKILQVGTLPMVIAPELTEINMVLPLAYWSPSLGKTWGNFQRLLEDSPLASTAQQVAWDIEKRPLEQHGPDWDVEAIPVSVTAAMVQEVIVQANRHGLTPKPMLSIGLHPDGRKFADIVTTHDPDTEIVFVSNGVEIVIRKDQLDQLRGSIIDFKSSAFHTGVVIRLPGD
jgi:Fe-S cluster assembly iron-binding protein IscA